MSKQQDADYLRSVGAPALFGHLAAELLKARPGRGELCSMLHEALDAFAAAEGLQASPTAGQRGSVASPADREEQLPQLQARAAKAFEGIDAQCSQDGRITIDEMLGVLRQEKLGARVLFRELGERDSGGLTAADWAAWIERVFEVGGAQEVQSRLDWIEDRLASAGKELTPGEAAAEELTARGRRLNGALQQIADRLAPEEDAPVAREPRPPSSQRSGGRKASVRFGC